MQAEIPDKVFQGGVPRGEAGREGRCRNGDRVGVGRRRRSRKGTGHSSFCGLREERGWQNVTQVNEVFLQVRKIVL